MGREICLVLAFDGDRRERFVMVRNARRGWELPGGVVEPDESGGDAAVREFAEETGRTLHHPRPIRLADGAPWHHVVVGLVGEAVRDPRPDRSIIEWRLVRWMDDVAPLAFPDDPYELLAESAGRPLRRPGSARGDDGDRWNPRETA